MVIDDNYDANDNDPSIDASQGLTPVNSDNADQPDYLDANSDNDEFSDLEENGFATAASGTDTDGDGLDDAFETARSSTIDDGFDVNDAIDDPLNGVLPDTDNDVAEDGNNATPPITDLDYRDNNFRPQLDLDGNVDGNDYSDTFTEGNDPLAVADVDADIDDFNENDLVELKIVIDPDTVVDGAAEILSVNGVSIPLNADLTNTNTTVGGVPVTITYTINDGELTIVPTVDTIPLSEDELDALVRDITYENTSQDPTPGDRTLTFSVTDNENQTSEPAVSTITVAAQNDAPTLDLDDDNSSGATGSDYINLTTGEAVAIADTDTTIIDVDDTNIESATVTLTNPRTGDRLLDQWYCCK